MIAWWHEQEWTNRRILSLLAIGTLIVSALWHLPQEFEVLAFHTGEIVFALVLALGFTYTLRPVVNAAERLLLHRGTLRTRPRTRRTCATSLVFLGGLALLWCFGTVGLKPIAVDAQNFWHAFMAHGPGERHDMIERWEQSISHALEPYRELLPADTIDEIEAGIPHAIVGAKIRFNEWALRSFSHIGFLVELILVPVLVFYFLADGRTLRDEAKLLCPPRWCSRVARVMYDLDRVLDGYIRGQVIMCLIAWVLVTIGLVVLGVPHPFALGLLAGLTRAVPIIGPLLGAIPIALVCLLFTQSLETTGILLALFTAMHFLESKVLLPRIIGHEVDLHPVSVILALLLGMELFGFVGVVLAVPFAALVKILLIEWQNGAWSPAPAEQLALPLESLGFTGTDDAAETSPPSPLPAAQKASNA
jgi:predicted PurR-regulated permease PerM